MKYENDQHRPGTAERLLYHSWMYADIIRAKLNIPENEEIMSVIAIGKRAGEPAVRPRKGLEETVKYY